MADELWSARGAARAWHGRGGASWVAGAAGETCGAGSRRLCEQSRDGLGLALEELQERQGGTGGLAAALLLVADGGDGDAERPGEVDVGHGEPGADEAHVGGGDGAQVPGERRRAEVGRVGVFGNGAVDVRLGWIVLMGFLRRRQLGRHERLVHRQANDFGFTHSGAPRGDWRGAPR